ncbi:protein of unknown function [Lishizhenia tianjinensis]|uniref:DUF4856 domain-containing protein n=1 Tax=Lishizhenia tianjinensis TaxID=477690 RepID=A0A1I7AFK4_9FLAO|nr:DUF4856 domain-containing protein [Lishizhenia tianjinensis]SFT73742.1 protein of unknown function [Lishizhenia tianjinensis]
MNKSKALLVLVAGAMAFTACKKEGCTDETASNYSEEAKKDDGSCVYIDNSPLAPTTYEFTDAEGNSTVSYGGQQDRLAQLSEMVALMKSGVNAPVSAQDLQDMFANTGDNGNGNFTFSSSKQLKDKCFSADVSFFEDALDSMALASQSYDMTAAYGQAGIVTNGTRTYLLGANGIEYTQLIEKGLMGAVLMYQANNVYFSDAKMDVDNTTAVDATAGKYYTTMEHHFDEAFGYFGVDVDFPTTIPDHFWGEYCNSRDTELSSNSVMMNNFLKGRFAITQKDYTSRDEAIEAIQVMWEKIAARQAVHYLDLAIANFGTDDALYFHTLSEALGFTMCIRYAAQDTRVLTQTELNAILAMYGDNFWDLTLVDLNNIKAAINAKY